MLTARAIERQVREASDRFMAEVAALARIVRQERVIPVCKRYRLDYTAGMGMFVFFDRNGHTIEKGDRKYLDGIYAILYTEVNYNHMLGDFIEDVLCADL